MVRPLHRPPLARLVTEQLLALAFLSVTTELEGVLREVPADDLALALALRSLAHHQLAPTLGMELQLALASLSATYELYAA